MWEEDIDNMKMCQDTHPSGLNQCYGKAAKLCPYYDMEDEADDNELCRHCQIQNSRGYCEITHPEHPESIRPNNQ